MEHLLEVDNLKTTFTSDRGVVTAVDGVSFYVDKGEILGIVGESGCGKSVTSQSIMRLYDEKKLAHYNGEIRFCGQNILDIPINKMEKIRGNDISMIFQDSLSSLNPVFTIGNQIIEALMIHQNMSKKEARSHAIELLKLTGIPAADDRVDCYPHELSGGMRQRAMIAMALACEPKLLIADEPTTALDVTIQAQILELLIDLNKKLDMGVMMITHDLGVVAQICKRVVVMYLGQIVEEGPVNEIFANPKHPYTKGLMASIPKMDSDKSQPLSMIPGTVPALTEVKSGCRFCERCSCADDKCKAQMPEIESVSDYHKVRCHKALD